MDNGKVWNEIETNETKPKQNKTNQKRYEHKNRNETKRS